MSVPERIRFYFDPLCPWCYQTSRWARRLEEDGLVDIDWRVFSLAIANRDDEGRAAATDGAAPALRVSVALRERDGVAAVGRFYAALGAAVHERGEDVADPGVLGAAIEAANADPALLQEVLGDPRTWEMVQREHDDAVQRLHAFGVPTIELANGSAMFGPIVIDVPNASEGRELWEHFRWLTQNANVAELKRHRDSAPDLESVRRYVERKAKEHAAAA